MSGEANKNSEIDKAHCLTANWLFSVHGIDERVPEHRLQIADLVT